MPTKLSIDPNFNYTTLPLDMNRRLWECPVGGCIGFVYAFKGEDMRPGPFKSGCAFCGYEINQPIDPSDNKTPR